MNLNRVDFVPENLSVQTLQISSNASPWPNLSGSTGMALTLAAGGALQWAANTEAGSISAGNNIQVVENAGTYTIGTTNIMNVPTLEINSAYSLPQSIGSAGQVLAVQSGSTALDWQTPTAQGEITSTTLTITNQGGNTAINLPYALPASLGASGQVLESNGAATQWATPAASGIQSLSSGNANITIGGTQSNTTVTLAPSIAVTTVQAANVTISGAGYTLPTTAPQANQVIQYNGTATEWTTFTDGGITTVTSPDGNIAPTVDGSTLELSLSTSITLTQPGASTNAINGGSIVINDTLNNTNTTITNNSVHTSNMTVTNAANTPLYTLPTSAPTDLQIMKYSAGAGAVEWTSDGGINSASSPDGNIITSVAGGNLALSLANTIAPTNVQTESLTMVDSTTHAALYSLPTSAPTAAGDAITFDGTGLTWSPADALNSPHGTISISGSAIDISDTVSIVAANPTFSLQQEQSFQSCMIRPDLVRVENLQVSNAANTPLYTLPPVQPTAGQIMQYNAGALGWVDYVDTSGIQDLTSPDGNLAVSVLDVGGVLTGRISLVPNIIINDAQPSIKLEETSGQATIINSQEVRASNIIVIDAVNNPLYSLPTALGSSGQVLGVNAGALEFITNSPDGVASVSANANNSIVITGTAENPIIGVNQNLGVDSIEVAGVMYPQGTAPGTGYSIVTSAATLSDWAQVVSTVSNTDGNIVFVQLGGNLALDLATDMNLSTVTANILRVANGGPPLYTFPQTSPSAIGQVLTYNGTGLTWDTPASDVTTYSEALTCSAALINHTGTQFQIFGDVAQTVAITFYGTMTFNSLDFIPRFTFDANAVAQWFAETNPTGISAVGLICTVPAGLLLPTTRTSLGTSCSIVDYGSAVNPSPPVNSQQYYTSYIYNNVSGELIIYLSDLSPNSILGSSFGRWIGINTGYNFDNQINRITL